MLPRRYVALFQLRALNDWRLPRLAVALLVPEPVCAPRLQPRGGRLLLLPVFVRLLPALSVVLLLPRVGVQLPPQPPYARLQPRHVCGPPLPRAVCGRPLRPACALLRRGFAPLPIRATSARPRSRPSVGFRSDSDPRESLSLERIVQ